MNQNNRYFWVILLGAFLSALHVFGQSKPSAQIESKNITTEEDLVISVSTEQTNNTEGLPYQFPEINFFRKVGVSRGKASRLVNNQLVNVVIYSQHYRPQNAGIFQIPSLELIIHQQSLKVDPFEVRVVKGLENPMKDEQMAALDAPKEIVLNKNKIFLLVSSNVYRPFVGQGFTLKFSLYIPENNAENLEFDHNEIQIPLQLQHLKLINCWQENFDLQEEKVISTVWQGVKYKEYRFFQSTYYALDDQIIQIPSLKLRLMKLTKKGNETQKIPIEFKSIPFHIAPKRLPKGISPTKIPVGHYELIEKVSRAQVSTGEKITYSFNLIGDGNTFAIEDREAESDYFLRFTTFSKEEFVFPSRNKMIGNNSQKIQIIPKQPGKFALKKYFYWVYFNTDKSQVDTLYSKLILEVSGKPEDAKLNTSEEPSELYQGIENISSEVKYWDTWTNWQRVVNLLLFVLFSVFVYLLTGSRKK